MLSPGGDDPQKSQQGSREPPIRAAGESEAGGGDGHALDGDGLGFGVARRGAWIVDAAAPDAVTGLSALDVSFAAWQATLRPALTLHITHWSS